MVKFTLKLSDYLDQYQHNIEDDNNNCPVCYSEECIGDIEHDVSHILDCYKNQAIELELLHHMDKNGEVPDIDELFIETISNKIDNEIFECSAKRKKR